MKFLHLPFLQKKLEESLTPGQKWVLLLQGLATVSRKCTERAVQFGTGSKEKTPRGRRQKGKHIYKNK